jgi:hypothetical protein
MRRLVTWILLTAASSFGTIVSALPEYAARYGINSCTACHFSPVGGGPRTINGKLFGAHGYALNPALIQEYVSADFRGVFYYPERANQSKSGLGIMSGSVAGHVALDEAQKIHLVIESNIAGFQLAAARDTYGLYQFSPEGKPAWFESLMIGRFRAPFGIITDEHRTYTRLQSGTEWYAMEAGVMLSGEVPKADLHYDLAWLSGENTGGEAITQNGAGLWGTVLNLRYMPGPVMWGASYSYHRHDPRSDSRMAASIYAIVSLGRWTESRVPVTIELEAVRAWNWGGNLGRGFVNDPGYGASLTKTQSQGYLTEITWQVSPHFSWLYKMGYLTPDRNYPADYYSRHGIGFRWWPGPNVEVQLRAEMAQATPPSEKGSLAWGAENATYALLQLSF